MAETWLALKQGKICKLTVKEDRFVVITGRAQEGLKLHHGVTHLLVIMAGMCIAFLIMLDAHEQDHANHDTTLLTATQTPRIMGGHVLAGKVKYSCIQCCFLDKKLAGQKIAILPQELTLWCTPFTHVGLDLAGPVTMKIVGASKQACIFLVRNSIFITPAFQSLQLLTPCSNAKI